MPEGSNLPVQLPVLRAANASHPVCLFIATVVNTVSSYELLLASQKSQQVNYLYLTPICKQTSIYSNVFDLPPLLLEAKAVSLDKLPDYEKMRPSGAGRRVDVDDRF